MWNFVFGLQWRILKLYLYTYKYICPELVVFLTLQKPSRKLLSIIDNDADDENEEADEDVDDNDDEDLRLNRSGPQYQNLHGEHTVRPLGRCKNISHEHTNFLPLFILIISIHDDDKYDDEYDEVFINDDDDEPVDYSLSSM